MSHSHDKTGKRFGMITAREIERWHVDNKYYSRPAVWLGACDCGRIVSVRTSDLTFVIKTSCGLCVATEIRK